MYNFFPVKYYSVVKENAEFLDPLLIMAIIKAESGFNQEAISKAGAVGLMQIMPNTAQWLNTKNSEARDIANPVDNIVLGIRYLKYLYELYNGDLDQILRAYNAGPRKASEDERIGKNYARKVKVFYYAYKVLYFWLR